jgi:hypothetical protein
MRSRLALALLLLLLSPAAGVAPGALSAHSSGGDAPTADLPPGAAPIVELLRQEPTDPDRLARVLRWTRENGGTIPIGAALAAAPRDPLDRFVAGLLLDAGGRPDIALGVLREACSIAPIAAPSSGAPSSGAPSSEAASSEAALLLAQLWVRAGRPDLAAALPLDRKALPLPLHLALLATEGEPGEEAARTLAAAAPLSPSARRDLLLEAGLPALAAELAEARGDATGALQAHLRAGDPAAALRWLERGAVPAPEELLDLIRWSGRADLVTATLPPPQLESAQRSLGRAPSPLAIGDALAPAPSPSREDPIGELGLARAERLLTSAGWSPAEEGRRRPLREPPSLPVAVALLDLGLEESAAEEVARWRLFPTPGEEGVRQLLEERRPRWWGLEESDGALLRRVERTVPADANAPLARALDRALLRSAAGSPREAALLFHRGRLFPARTEGSPGAGSDRERAARIAPGALVRTPGPGGLSRLRPLGGADPATILAATALPEGDATIGGRIPAEASPGVAVPLRLPSRLPALADEGGESLGRSLAIVEWEEDRTASTIAPPPITRGHPLAPVRGWVELGGAGGTIVIGRGIALHAADGALLAAVEAESAADPATIPSSWLEGLPPPLHSLLSGLRPGAPIELDDHPSIREAWERVRRRQGLGAEDAPESIHGRWVPSDDGASLEVVLRGGGLRVLLRDAPAPRAVPPPPPWPAAAPPSLHEGGLWWWRAPGADSAPPEDPRPAGVDGTAPLALLSRRRVPATTPDRPALDPRADDPRAPRRTPEGNRFEVRRVFSDWTLSFSSDGWVAGSRGDETLWLAWLEPPLPGAQGWRLVGATPRVPPLGRRGPDLTGSISDAGTCVVERADAERAILRTDRAWVLAATGPVPFASPVPPLGGMRAFSVSAAGDAPPDWAALATVASELVTPTTRRSIGGAFGVALFPERIDLLVYDPRLVSAHLLRIDLRAGTTTPVPLPPAVTIEEDRAAQSPIAIARFGDDTIVCAHGQLWRAAEGWRPLLPERESPPAAWLPSHAWQLPPVLAPGRVWIGWPWGEIEEWGPR